MPGIDIEVTGLVETRRKLRQVAEDMHGKPIVQAVRESAFLVERDAKRNAPVDRGRLRNSITSDIRQSGRDVIGVVGSPVKYAPNMELGTGTFVGKPPHFPPPSALRLWAARHGMNAFLVARAIFRRGGLKPRRFLQGAFDMNMQRIRLKIENAVRQSTEK